MTHSLLTMSTTGWVLLAILVCGLGACFWMLFMAGAERANRASDEASEREFARFRRAIEGGRKSR